MGEVSEQLYTEMAAAPAADQERGATVSLLIVVVAMGLLAGAAIHTSLPVFLTVCAGIALWLAAFAARERLTRARRH